MAERIATESYASALTGKQDNDYDSLHCCTRKRAIQLGCAVDDTHTDNLQLVPETSLSVPETLLLSMSVDGDQGGVSIQLQLYNIQREEYDTLYTSSVTMSTGGSQDIQTNIPLDILEDNEYRLEMFLTHIPQSSTGMLTLESSELGNYDWQTEELLESETSPINIILFSEGSTLPSSLQLIFTILDV